MLSPGEGLLLVTDSSSDRDHMITQISMAIQDIVATSAIFAKERAKYCLVAEGSGELYQVKEVEEVVSKSGKPQQEQTQEPQSPPKPTPAVQHAARSRRTLVRGSLADTTYVESDQSFELVYSDELGWHLAEASASKPAQPAEAEQTTPPIDNLVPCDPIPTHPDPTETNHVEFSTSQTSGGQSTDDIKEHSRKSSVEYSSSPGGQSLEENLSRVVLTSSAEYSSSPGGEYHISESYSESNSGKLTSSTESVGASESSTDVEDGQTVPVTKIPFKSTKPRAVVRSSHVRIGSGSGWQFCGPSLELKKEFEEFDKFMSQWATSTVGSGSPQRDSLRYSKQIVIGKKTDENK